MNENPSPGARFLAVLASLRLTVVGLGLLLILTIWGTLYQVDNGLFQAQQRFYQSWFFLAAGFFPFPGAKLVMIVLFVNLFSAGLRLSMRKRLKWGLIFTHGGLLLMLAASAVTFYIGQESNLTLIEGEASNVSSSTHDWELAVWPETTGNEKEVSTLDARFLAPGATIPLPSGKGEITVANFYEHSEPLKSPADKTPAFENASGIADVRPLPPQKDPGGNRPTVTFTFRSGNEKKDILLWGGETELTTAKSGDTTFVFELRRRRFLLPATVQLIKFTKELHPGSDMARSFSSQVDVRPEHGTPRKVTISMNKPLRFQGFTFYQASYNALPDGREASTLAVVKNYGRVMPYVATGVTALGMMLHFLGRLVMRVQRGRKTEVPS